MIDSVIEAIISHMQTEADTAGRKPIDAQPPVKRGDRWLVKQVILAMACVFVLVLFCGLPGALNFPVILIVALGGPIFGVTLLILSAYFLSRKEMRKAGSVAVIAVLPVLLWSPIVFTTKLVHLWLTIGFGIGQLGNVTPPTRDKLVVFDWSVGLVGGLNTFLIHDPTDEIAFPLGQHKRSAMLQGGLEEECAGRVEHLLGHNYVCSF